MQLTSGRFPDTSKPARVLLAALLLGGLACVPGVGADIYKFVGKDGVIRLADRPMGPGYRLVVKSRKKWDPGKVHPHPENRRRFQPIIDQAAHRFSLNQALIHAVIATESGYDPKARSRAGALGLMQLMPETASAYGVTDPRDPNQNVLGGSRYLRELLRRYQDLELALAAYNAGESAVARYGNRVPPYPETRDYVDRVLKRFRQNLQRREGGDS